MSDDRRYPEALAGVIAQFARAPQQLRLPLLLEYAGKLPKPAEGAGELERVHECQTPLFLRAEVEGGRVRLAFDAPEEAPTTRGFASVVHAGLDGATIEEVLATPDDFYQEMGLASLISPLRLRGMGAIVSRVKRQVRERA